MASRDFVGEVGPGVLPSGLHVELRFLSTSWLEWFIRAPGPDLLANPLADFGEPQVPLRSCISKIKQVDRVGGQSDLWLSPSPPHPETHAHTYLFT